MAAIQIAPELQPALERLAQVLGLGRAGHRHVKGDHVALVELVKRLVGQVILGGCYRGASAQKQGSGQDQRYKGEEYAFKIGR